MSKCVWMVLVGWQLCVDGTCGVAIVCGWYLWGGNCVWMVLVGWQLCVDGTCE